MEGMSAYESWLMQGNVGSEADFIESLKGGDGKDGKDGRDGIDAFDPVAIGVEVQSGISMVIGSVITKPLESVATKTIEGTFRRLKDSGQLTGPKGKDGKDGLNGKDGAPGAPGKDGRTGRDGINGINGLPGKDGKSGKDGQKGEKGDDGKSAYDIWLDEGHKGSENEFINNIAARASAYVTNTNAGGVIIGPNRSSSITGLIKAGTNVTLSGNGTVKTPYVINATGGGGGGTPSGSNGQVQFNNAGAFGADNGFFWDNTNKRLGVGTSTPTQTLSVEGSGTISGNLFLPINNVFIQSAGQGVFFAGNGGIKGTAGSVTVFGNSGGNANVTLSPTGVGNTIIEAFTPQLQINALSGGAVNANSAPGLKIFAAANSGKTAFTSADNYAYIETTATTAGSYPFNNAGNLIIQSRGSVTRDIVMVSTNGSNVPTIANVTNFVGTAWGTNSPTNSITLGALSTGASFYNTTDQSVNFERVSFGWNTNIFQINSLAGGTGIQRAIGIYGGTVGVTIDNAATALSMSTKVNISSSVTSVTGGAGLISNTGTIQAASGVQNFCGIFPTVNQSGTGGYNALYVSSFEQAIGSGARLLINAGTNNQGPTGAGTHTSKFTVDANGTVTAAANIVTPGSFVGAAVASTTNDVTLGLQVRNFTGSNPGVSASFGTYSGASVNQTAFRIVPTYNQTGTSGATDLLVNRTETAVGSGSQLLADFQVGGSSRLAIDNNGNTNSIGVGTFNGGFRTSSSGLTVSNFGATPGVGLSSTGTTGIAANLFGGASAVAFRAIFSGSTAGNSVNPGSSYSNVIVGSSPVNTAATGTHAVLANMVVNPIGLVTSGGAAVTNTASLYVQGAATGGTNNYAVLVNSPNVPFSINGEGAPMGQSTQLFRVNGLNSTTTANTLAYTNNTGKTVAITNAMVVCTAATAITTGPAIGIGTASGTNDIFGSVAMNALNSTSRAHGMTANGGLAVVPNGGTVYINLTAATGTSQTISIGFMGFAY